MRRTSNLFVIGILFLTLYGFVLRVWELGGQSMWIDEGFTVYGSQIINDVGVPYLASGEVYGNGILASYVTALFIKVLPFDPFSPWSARVPAVVFGTALIPALYIFSRKMFGIGCIPILVSAVAAFSYWEIAWSRQARGYAGAAFLIVLALTFLWRYYESGNHRFNLWAILLIALASLFQGSSAVLFLCVPMVVLTRLVEKDSHKSRLYPLWISIGLIAAAGTAKYMITGSLSSYGWISIMEFPKSTLIFFFLSLPALFLVTLDNKTYRPGLFLVVCTLVSTGSILLFSQVAHLRYLFIIFPLFIILSTYSIKVCIDLLFPDAVKLKNNILVSTTVIVVLCIPSGAFLPANTYWLEWGSFQPDFASVFKTIKSQYSEGDKIISNYPRIHKVYMGKEVLSNSLALPAPFDITGRPQSVTDRFTGVPIISGMSDLKNTLNTKHGFVIIDSMTKARHPEVYSIIKSTVGTREIYYSVAKNKGTDIHLFKF